MPVLNVVFPDRYRTLEEHLAQKTRARPEFERMQAAILAPVNLLIRMGELAPQVLLENPWAMERMRLLASKARPLEIDGRVSAALSGDVVGNELPPYRPCLIDPAALVVLGIAMARVGMELQTPRASMTTVPSLAKACGPAEMVCKSPWSTREILEIMEMEDPEASLVASLKAAIGLFVNTRMERARWRCIDRLFSIEFGNHRLWEQTRPNVVILGVQLGDAGPGKTVTIRLRRRDSSREQPRILHVAFVSAADRNATPMGSEVWEEDSETIEAQVPADASPGWIGVSDGDDYVHRLNAYRSALRKRWNGFDDACLGGQSVPVDRFIPDLNRVPVPPQTAANAFDGGNSVLRAGSAVVVRVVMIRPTLVAPGEPPFEARVSREETAQVRRRLLETRALEISEVSLPWIEDGLAAISVPPDRPTLQEDVPRVDDLLVGLSLASMRTPGLEDALWVAVVPGEAAWSQAVPSHAARAVAVATRSGLVELLSRPGLLVAPSEDAPIEGRLRFVARWRKPGGVATDRPIIKGSVGLSRRRELGTRLLSLDQHGDLLLDDPPGEDSVAVVQEEEISIVELRKERRQISAGPRRDTGAIAVGLGSQGIVLFAQPLSIQLTATGALLSALLPWDHRLVRLEIRRTRQRFETQTIDARSARAGKEQSGQALHGRGRLLKRFTRNTGRIRLEGSLEESGKLVWGVGESNGALPRIVLEARAVSKDDVIHEPSPWVPLAAYGAQDSGARVPLHRLTARRVELRLVASHGWVTVERPLGEATATRFRPVVARFAGKDVYWAELPEAADGLKVEWRFDKGDRPIGTARVLELAAERPGRLELKAIGDDDSQTDERQVLVPVVPLTQRQAGWRWPF